MAENRKGGQATARNKVEKALIQALEEDMGEIPEASITVDELKALESADKKKRKKRTVRYVSVAAIAVIVCAAVVYVAWPETAVPVDADKNTEQRVETGDGEIVINEGDGVGEIGITEYNETNWDAVRSYQEKFPGLGIPQYIPEEYNFNNLNIEKYSKEEFYACFTYEKGKEPLLIEQRTYREDAAKTSFITEGAQTIKTKLGTAYAMPQEGGSTFIIINLKTGDLSVKGTLDTKELIKILDNVEMP
ncbi:DUF4367 domain-containing protein [Anaerovorax odorimutans]|uniref:DUF4367 domain-containing protein n=1 Tax=Anaerovorax odorimutans TaxID=109327 RepID=A0ABT1RU10_9FIRM|nr:DUF4367 domain-containing protein [Anaerovorax odorimutans]MCQ4638321.1 DUF4367 domain-containing protein [Anaerovorax odorimutans]